ncbi:hypothetical protein [Leifsonia sp. 21MFCrub1.1]|uniref:hypothetical protein n=1 Tax=Leifsonia sp. 21MFCrub1.1 TaxID=1798223 RepID=UPI0008928656|nr:hypothetical protein [Leifsonia sp. 21MFCrub1.1]SEB11264.1 hypothetical protein SAMN04515680_3363 [Leifsonia sp. 21MFCrub1.1]
MTKDERASLPPGPDFSYGGYTVRLEPEHGRTGRWRVIDDESYYGLVAAAEPLRGEPEVHFAAHFPGEEDIPPMKIVPLWTLAVEFLLDAGKGEALWGLPDDRTAPHPIVADELAPPTGPVETQDAARAEEPSP